MQKPKAVFCWSGGKDSALALYRIIQEDRFQVTALLTTFTAHTRRISMHRIPEQLMDAQAASIGIPLEKVCPADKSNLAYEQAMEEKLMQLQAAGVTHVLFGDIFLQDLREYRERMLRRLDLQGVFPLWQQDTASLIREFFRAGFGAVTCCVSSMFFSEMDAGRELDAHFIQQLPPGVDPCGENGEFHTFCYRGPLFSKPVPFEKGNKHVELFQKGSGQDGFWFIDLLPVADDETGQINIFTGR